MREKSNPVTFNNVYINQRSSSKIRTEETLLAKELVIVNPKLRSIRILASCSCK